MSVEAPVLDKVLDAEEGLKSDVQIGVLKRLHQDIPKLSKTLVLTYLYLCLANLFGLLHSLWAHDEYEIAVRPLLARAPGRGSNGGPGGGALGRRRRAQDGDEQTRIALQLCTKILILSKCLNIGVTVYRRSTP